MPPFVLVIVGTGPYCVARTSPDMRPGQDVQALCGHDGILSGSGTDAPFRAIPGDPLHDACRKIAGFPLR